MTILALINEQTMVCENVSIDDRPASDIQIAGFIVLDLNATPTISWEWDEQTQEWVKMNEVMGEGGIGFTYQNGKLIAPLPLVQPQTSGTQDL
jgi:hypothetical protein